MTAKIKTPKNWPQIVVAGFLIVWFGWYFVHPIDLFPADLGRHITNGRILLTEPENAWKLLHTNFYSFAASDAPFVNHHWLVGVYFFVVWKISGFVGLGVAHLIINLVTFLLFFRLAVRQAGFKIASLIAICTIPLLAERTEIRPETFSYLFSALFLTILSGVHNQTLRRRWLIALLPIQILWVNIHIYFFLGFGYVGAFWLASVLGKLNTKPLSRPFLYTLLAIGVVSLINPNGFRGALYPTQIFQNYAFVISENQSVLEYLAAGRAHANVYVFVILSILLVVMLLYNWKKRGLRGELPETFIIIFLTLWSYSAIRNLALFGYYNMVMLALLISKNRFLGIEEKNIFAGRRYALYATILVLISGLVGSARIKLLIPHTYFGLVANSQNVADFINKNNISGPLFNDFDIGGYTIFNFFPRVPPFNDNRPEAYPATFMTNIYVPMQTNEIIWKEQLKKYNFNVIVYSFEDHAPWATGFIVKRLIDPDWAPVYADNFGIIFLRRNNQNSAIIQQYEMSKDSFSLTQKK